MADKQVFDLVQRLLEAPIDAGDYPDYIHPEKKTKMAKRSHPMAKNPAYPKYTAQAGAKPQNWEELLASEQYQKTLERLAKYMADMDPRRRNAQGQPKSLAGTGLHSIMGAMFQAITTAQGIEAAHKEELEQLAIQLVFEQPEFKKLLEPYRNGEFKIDAKLEQADLSRAVVSPETQAGGEDEEDEEEAPAREEAPAGEERLDQEEAALQRMANFNPEVEKRKVINAMIQGAAVSKNYAYNLVHSELNAIDPRLLAFYGVAMAGSELGYFATPDAMAAVAVQSPELSGGSSELEFEGGGEEGGQGVPIIRARGMIFPMLVQEITKGLMELMSYEGLPENPEAAQDVIDKTDFVDHESWAMIMGRGLWTRFVSALGGNEDEITMHLYNRIVQMPPDQFNKAMQTIQAGGSGAQQFVKRLAQDVRMDMEAQDRNEAGYGPEKEEEPPEYPEGQEPWR